jgi:hypothetical protein
MRRLKAPGLVLLSGFIAFSIVFSLRYNEARGRARTVEASYKAPEKPKSLRCQQQMATSLR